MSTCKTCLHRHKLSSGKRLAMYCIVHASARTKCGKLRVKCNQPGCEHYVLCMEAPKEIPENQLKLFE